MPGTMSNWGKAAIVGIGLAVVAAACDGAARLYLSAKIGEALVAGLLPYPWLGRWYLTASNLTIQLGTLVGAVCFIAWFKQRYEQLGRWGIVQTRFSSAKAVVYWFVPVLGLIRPEQIAQEIWNASDPNARSYPPAEYNRRSRLIEVWWVLFILHILANRLAEGAHASAISDLHTATTRPLALAAFQGVALAFRMLAGADFLTIASGLLAIAVVVHLETRQNQKSARMVTAKAAALG